MQDSPKAIKEMAALIAKAKETMKDVVVITPQTGTLPPALVEEAVRAPRRAIAGGIGHIDRTLDPNGYVPPRRSERRSKKPKKVNLPYYRRFGK